MKPSLITFLFFLTIIACKDKQNTNETKAVKDYTLRMSVYGKDGFSLMFHVAPQFGDTLIIGKCLVNKFGAKTDSCTFKNIKLDQSRIDSLYGFFNHVILDFKLDSTPRQVETDNKGMLLYMSSGNKTITIGYASFSDARKASPYLTELLNFINNKLEDELKIKLKD